MFGEVVLIIPYYINEIYVIFTMQQVKFLLFSQFKLFPALTQWYIYLTVSRNHRIIYIGRDLERLPSAVPCSKQIQVDLTWVGGNPFQDKGLEPDDL